MKQYIDKAAVAAEINNWIKNARHRYTMSVVQFSLSDRIKSLENLLSFLDTLEVKKVQEESVSKDLEEAAFDYAEACKYDGGEKLLCVEHFKDGAKWQQLMSNTLPNIPLDLEKEIKLYKMRNPIIGHREESLKDYMSNVAEHFFELGLKAQKGE